MVRNVLLECSEKTQQGSDPFQAGIDSWLAVPMRALLEVSQGHWLSGGVHQRGCH